MQAVARNIQNEINDTPAFTAIKTAKHILYIDDDPDDQENFRFALERCNAKITLTTAQDADEALEKLSSQSKPACIYLDINMPKINGIQLLELLKLNTDFAEIPVVIFSTSVDTKSRKEAMNLGAAGVFVKPSSLVGLMEHIRDNLSLHF
jgi:CheY-like chemotaxis protein